MATKPKVSESCVLSACISYLNQLKASGLLTFKRINVSGIPISTRGRIRGFRPNPMAGLGDLLIFFNSDPPRTIQVEVKSTLGKQSDIQKDWQEELGRYGHSECYFVCRSLRDLENVINQHSTYLNAFKPK
jgi:hypothetical protein